MVIRTGSRSSRMLSVTALAMAAVFGLAVACGPVVAQGVGTGLVVDTDPGLQLRCADTIAFNVTPQRLTAIVTGTGTVTGEVTRSSPATSTNVTSSISGWDVTIQGLDTSTNALSFTDEALDICEVRATTFNFGTYTVSVGFNGPVALAGPSGSTVNVTGVRTRAGFSTGAYTNGFGVNWFTLFFLLGSRFTVDFEIDFDLSTANRAGQHSSGGSGVFTVTASSPQP